MRIALMVIRLILFVPYYFFGIWWHGVRKNYNFEEASIGGFHDSSIDHNYSFNHVTLNPYPIDTPRRQPVPGASKFPIYKEIKLPEPNFCYLNGLYKFHEYLNHDTTDHHNFLK